MSTQIEETNTKPNEAPEVPEWLDDTPWECTYALTMFETGGGNVQSVDLSRDEYILLKEYVAHIRGIRLLEALEAPAGMAGAVAEIAADAAVTALAQRIGELNSYDEELLTVALECLERGRGCTTPGEEFIESILAEELIRPLTPFAAESRLEEFRRNFKDMQDEAGEFMKRYPANIAEPKEAV